MKYCPNCGKSEIQGMKFCPQCGQSLSVSDLEEEKRYLRKPKTTSREEKWSERHPGWILLLVIVCGPFIAWGIAAALIALAMFLPSGIDEAAAIGAITAMPVAYIAMVITTVRWYRQKRKHGKTIADYTQRSGLHIDNADACFQRTDDNVEAGEYSKAIADYNKAIELNPNDADDYYNRGCTYGEMGEYEKAIADFDRVIQLNPSDTGAYYSRGLAYKEKGDLHRAAIDLEKCIELSSDPDFTKDAQQALYEIKNSS